ncbi:UNVERIFIED_CONTAM: hypothetical protein FKN15_024548 [Acipenser sinensis]
MHSLSFGLQHKQEARQQSDSLHSLHSSSKPPPAPSVPASSKVSSSEEEDSYSKGSFPFLYSSVNKNGSRARSLGRSSGSEEDSSLPVAHNRDNIRRRSLRKKKKNVLGSRNNRESDDSDDGPVMEPLERRQRPYDLDYLPCKDSEGSRSRYNATMGADHATSFTSPPWDHRPCPSLESSYPSQRSGDAESYKRHHRGASEGGISPAGSFHGSSRGSPIPGVSRIAKVNIPSFLDSPCGSRSSSRHSSTETLKEDDQPTTCSAVTTSKSFHGNFTLYRSPSFSHCDSISRPHGRVRPNLPFGNVQVKPDCSAESRSHHRHALVSDKSKHRMSMSNPDIASETMTLLSFLKTDLSELRVRKKGRGVDASGGNHRDSYQNMLAHSPAYRTRGTPKSSYHLSPHGRPSLKDLTATLRRAKSFTYSEKPVGRPDGGTVKPSSSELMLSSMGDSDAAVSDREVESDVGQRDDDTLTYQTQDQYIQEARQVFKDISQMGTQEEYSYGMDYMEGECFRGMEEADGQPQEEIGAAFLVEKRESEKCLRKGESEENLSCGKSVDELSGHESSLTDEGIVTEPETGLCGSTLDKDILGQPLTVWKQPSSALQREDQADLQPGGSPPPSVPAVRTDNENMAIGGETTYSKNASQGPLEAPSTPSAIRRRRTFSSAGNNGSDSSNGSNGESSGETFRSLSDPMPHRRCLISEDKKNFSVDSNLLGSLNSKNGIPEFSATDLSECTGSAASDLSVCSDGLKDYNTVIQSIVSEPGAMDKLIDDKGNGKVVKKKSFSDPSRRGESDTPGFKGPSEPINEMEQAILPSSSEPILSEQRDEVGELEELGRQDRKPCSQSEHVLPSYLEQDALEEAPGFTFDPKLAEVLSPRMMRRSYKKRNNRATHQEGKEQQQQSTEIAHHQPVKPRPASKHVRHASEPATFIPIVTPESHLSQSHPIHITAPEPSRQPQKPLHIVQAPSLEDVTKQYMLALNSVDSPLPAATDASRSTPVTPTTAEPKLLQKPSEELNPAANKSKPQVVSEKIVFCNCCFDLLGQCG